MSNKGLSKLITCAEVGIWWQDPSVAAAACEEAGLEDVHITKSFFGSVEDAIALFGVLLGRDYEFNINSEDGVWVVDSAGTRFLGSVTDNHARSLMISTLKAYRNKVYGFETYVTPPAVAKLIAARKG